MRKVKAHFKQEAPDFDDIINRSIPHYPQMLEAIVDSLAFPKSSSPEILDLGSGTGALAKNILSWFPEAKITVLDFVPEMLKIAQSKLLPLTKSKDQVKSIQADFSKWQFDQKYDAVVANLTLHHLQTGKSKQNNYRLIFKNLKPGGILCVGDIILGSNKMLTKMYIDKWLAFQKSQGWTDGEIAERMQRYKTEDYPASLEDHLKWLREVGFSGVDCVWKHYNFAVFGGRKNEPIYLGQRTLQRKFPKSTKLGQEAY